MKKFLLIAVAAFGMLMTACSKDEVAQPVGGEESVVTFTVEAPVMQTRATEPVHGDGTLAKNLTYAVYNRVDGDKLFEGTATMDEELKTTVKIPFVNGMLYDILFWAESANSPYSVNWEAKTVGYDPTVTLVSNSMDYDAFYYFLTGDELPEITGPVTKTVELKRPFAQLNIATNDTEDADDSGLVVENVAVEVTNAYTQFSLVSGNGVDDTNTGVTFASAPKQGGKILTDYDLLAVNYLFTGGEKQLVNVKFTYTDSETKGGNAGRTAEYNSVPVQRNYRTNIVGSLLTSEGNFNIVTLPGFDGEPGHEVEVVSVASAVELVDEITNGDADQIILTGDINLNDLLSRAADKNLAIPAGRTVTLDLGGHTLSAVSTQTGKNYEMIDVRGTLTVANGTITTEHTGTNMGWNNSTNVFNVTAGGVLNLESVVAKNLGGSDMAFVAHLNNWGEATLNVNNSTLESTYIAVRVFNSGYDMNNVTIKNTTLKGKYCFWVHNYKAAGDSVGTDETLNVDIYNNNNTFVYTSKAPILYGFDSPIYFDENGNKLVYSVDDLASAIAVGGELTLQNDIEASDIIFIGNSVKINGNGHSISTTANRVMRITAPEINVELNNVNIVSKAVRVESNEIRGISIDNTASDLTLTLNDCNIGFTDASAHDWAYAVNQTPTTHNTISINGGTYEGANAINICGSHNIIYIDGATLNCLYKPNTQYHGNCIAFVSGTGFSANDNTLTVKNTTFNSPGGNAIAIWDNGSNNTISEENNTDNTTKATFITTTEALEETGGVLKSGTVLALNGAEYNGKITAEGDLTIMGDTKIQTLQAVNGGTITIEDGKTLTLNNFSFGSKDTAGEEYEIKGGTVVANYGFFQHGTYALRSNFKTGYMYYSYGSDITVYGTFHSEGKGDGLDYVRGKLTIATGGKSIHDKSLWIGQPANWGAMNASMTIEDGGYVQVNSLSVYEGSSLTYSNDADLKYNTVSGAEYIIKK